MTLAAVLLAGIAATLLLTRGTTVSAQSPVTPATVALNAPLPVFVTNPQTQLALPTNFHPGTRWRFTTWTSPSQIDWIGTVERVSGPWALITINLNGNTTARWYYVPAMPGSWEAQ